MLNYYQKTSKNTPVSKKTSKKHTCVTLCLGRCAVWVWNFSPKKKANPWSWSHSWNWVLQKNLLFQGYSRTLGAHSNFSILL